MSYIFHDSKITPAKRTPMDSIGTHSIAEIHCKNRKNIDKTARKTKKLAKNPINKKKSLPLQLKSARSDARVAEEARLESV